MLQCDRLLAWPPKAVTCGMQCWLQGVTARAPADLYDLPSVSDRVFGCVVGLPPWWLAMDMYICIAPCPAAAVLHTAAFTHLFVAFAPACGTARARAPVHAAAGQA